MLSLLRTIAVAVSFGVAGCAIHPLPEDVTGVPTTIIVRKMRCEARDAVKENLTQWLMAYPAGSYENKIGSEFENGQRPLKTFSASLFQGQVKSIVEQFENTAVAYDFSFDMTETDNIGATLGLSDAINKTTTFMAPLTGSANRMRENTRTFTITDTFFKLLTMVPDQYCNVYVDEKNYIYPITGTIGIGEMVHTFVVLTLFSNLSGDPSKGGPPTMGDVLKFTTAWSAGATPGATFTPVGAGLKIASATLPLTFSRSDLHQVTVALASPPPKTASTPKAATAKSSEVGFLVNARGSTAELTAAHTIEQMITRFELGKSHTVIVPNQ